LIEEDHGCITAGQRQPVLVQFIGLTLALCLIIDEEILSDREIAGQHASRDSQAVRAVAYLPDLSRSRRVRAIKRHANGLSVMRNAKTGR
jgi:hypothetical protein